MVDREIDKIKAHFKEEMEQTEAPLTLHRKGGEQVGLYEIALFWVNTFPSDIFQKGENEPAQKVFEIRDKMQEFIDALETFRGVE
jgi:hypothetical protein